MTGNVYMTATDTILFNPEVINRSYSYKEYRELIEELLNKEKTTGENHSEEMLHYSRMNLYRMDRLDKYAEMKPDLEQVLSNLKRKLIWLVLVEGWCGDVAQNLPIINKMAESTEKIEMKLILRDENLEVMDQFLTDGRSRSIPKLICMDAESQEVLGSWGPRPDTAQQMAKDLKYMNDLSLKEGVERLHKWYADDKNEEIQEEFLKLIPVWEKG
jgi:hypothetical protein